MADFIANISPIKSNNNARSGEAFKPTTTTTTTSPPNKNNINVRANLFGVDQYKGVESASNLPTPSTTISPRYSSSNIIRSPPPVSSVVTAVAAVTTTTTSTTNIMNNSTNTNSYRNTTNNTNINSTSTQSVAERLVDGAINNKFSSGANSSTSVNGGSKVDTNPPVVRSVAEDKR
jgi:hypothetical protein